MTDVAKNPYVNAEGKPRLRPSVVAFLDLLGYRSYIRTSIEQGTADKELQRLRLALDQAYINLQRPTQTGDPGDMEFVVRAFTDNVVIGWPIRDHYDPMLTVTNVVNYISYFQTVLSGEGYFIRGAISVGDLYVDEQIVFGPALEDAYQAESALAVNSRVILCDSAREAFRGQWPEQPVPDFLVDSDGHVFVDYLASTVMIAFPDGGPFTEFLESHRTAVIAKLKEFANQPYIRAKYEWAGIYHNSVCDRYSVSVLRSTSIQTDHKRHSVLL